MDITIGRYRIVSDIYSIEVKERKVTGEKSKTPGEEKWDSLGWYCSVPQALTALAHKHLNKSEASTVKEMKAICDEFLKAVDDKVGNPDIYSAPQQPVQPTEDDFLS